MISSRDLVIRADTSWLQEKVGTQVLHVLQALDPAGELANVRILNPEIYIPPGSVNLKAKGEPCARTSPARHRPCAKVRTGWEQ